MKKYYDAVIVGCGVAGCFAALHLPQEADILMITKADTEDSDSFLAQGGICVLKNESDYDAFYEDTMHAGHYENTPESVDIMIRSSQDVIRELIDYGVDFAKEDGELVYTRRGMPLQTTDFIPRGHYGGGDYRKASERSKETEAYHDHGTHDDVGSGREKTAVPWCGGGGQGRRGIFSESRKYDSCKWRNRRPL